jgi:5-methylcytosine-specific restriction enzyme subunit McrC
MLEVTELQAGLSIRSFSYVGRVQLGDVTITVVPKLQPASLLSLLRYAYGLRKLSLLPEVVQKFDQAGFMDLVAAQLVAESEELMARGLHRAYVPRLEQLAAPKGRVHVGRLAAQGGVLSARLPCVHYPRVENTPLNRAMRGGLELAGRIATDLSLRRTARRLVAALGEAVSPALLTGTVIERAVAALNRLTMAYTPAVTLTRLLFDAQGVVLGTAGTSARLAGFLFDMNRFFQALLSRFLRDSLPAYTLRDEHHLSGILRYIPGYNPKGRPAPIPRPDFLVSRGKQTVAILDAKYRDLWKLKLPRDMLYQLALYATSQVTRTAAILYPTTEAAAKEARIGVRDPVSGTETGQVHLRPVILPVLEGLVNCAETADNRLRRQRFAERLVFGT